MRVNASQILFWITLVFLMNGCGGGSSDESSDENNITDSSEFSISSRSASSGEFITLYDDSIISGHDLPVRFYNSSGIDITLMAIHTDNGFAKIPVPLLINSETGNVESGNVSVSIGGGKDASLTIESLPDVNELPSGYVVQKYLETVVTKLNNIELSLPLYELENNYDTAQLSTLISTQITSINSALNQLIISKSLSLYSQELGFIELTESDLKKMDQILYLLLQGVSNDLNSVTSEKSYRVSKKPQNPTQALIDSLINNGSVIKTIQNGKTVFIGASSMLVTIAAASVGSAGLGASFGFAALSGTMAVLTIGPVVEGMSAINAQNSGEAYQFGNQITELSQEALINTLVGLGSEASDIINLLAYLNTAYDVKNAFINQVCKLGPTPAEYKLYCEQETSPSTPTSEIFFLKAYRNEILSDSSTNLYFNITGHRAIYNTISIDWGDKSDITTFKWGHSADSLRPDFAYGIDTTNFSHQYVLPSDEPYNITLTLVRDGDLETSTSKTVNVLVKSSTGPMNIAYLDPVVLEINELGTWTFDVTGGLGPYSATIDWGDEVSQQAKSLFGEFKGAHSYDAEKRYTISLTIADSNHQTITEEYFMDIGDPFADNPQEMTASLCPEVVPNGSLNNPENYSNSGFSVTSTDGSITSASCGYRSNGGGLIRSVSIDVTWNMVPSLTGNSYCSLGHQESIFWSETDRRASSQLRAVSVDWQGDFYDKEGVEAFVRQFLTTLVDNHIGAQCSAG